jgi:hypothetical protein
MNETMTAKLFESALGITGPWYVASVEFDEGAKVLTVLIDFKAGSRFAVSGHSSSTLIAPFLPSQLASIESNQQLTTR